MATDRELIEAVAAEMTAGIECALDFWIAQIEVVLEDPRLTTLGRLQGVREIVRNYRRTVGTTTAPEGYVA